MPGDLWLVRLQHFHEKTNANFVFPHQVNQPQTGAIRERFEEQFNAVLLVSHLESCQPVHRVFITISGSAEFLYSYKI